MNPIVIELQERQDIEEYGRVVEVVFIVGGSGTGFSA